MVVRTNHLYRLIRSALLFLLIASLIVACHDAPKVLNDEQLLTDCRIVKHSIGETCVPADPQRIIVLTALDNVLILGVKPIGAATLERDRFRSFLPEQSDGTESVGLIGQPNLEKIVRLKPDLILGSYPKEIYAQLSKIAPTVIFWDGEARYLNWQNVFKAYADVLGKTKEAEQILSDYQQRVVEFKKQMGDRLSHTQISCVNFFASDARIYLKDFFGGQILEEVGLPRPPAQNRGGDDLMNLSLEFIPQMAGDVIFLLLGGHEKSKLEQFTNHPLWMQLKAVQNRRVYQVSNEVWIAGETPVAANLLLDDLFKYLIDEWK